MADKRVLCEGRHVRLVEEQGWEYVERRKLSGIVAIVAVTEDHRIVLVEQPRTPVGGLVLELPAGLAGDAIGHETEDLVTAARRELHEETGYEAGTWTRLASGPPSAGVSSEIVTFFRASGLVRSGPGGGDASERIRVHEVELDRIEDWLGEQQRRGALVDPKLYAGLYFIGRD